MGLPVVKLPRTTVMVGGEPVEVRGLSRAEAMRLPHFRDDPDAAETFLLARGVGISEDEALAWRNESPVDAVGVLVDAIIDLSGLGEEVSKSDGPGSDPGRA